MKSMRCSLMIPDFQNPPAKAKEETGFTFRESLQSLEFQELLSSKPEYLAEDRSAPVFYKESAEPTSCRLPPCPKQTCCSPGI